MYKGHRNGMETVGFTGTDGDYIKITIHSQNVHYFECKV